MKARRLWLKYGEETVKLNVRVPKSKYVEVQLKINRILKSYLDPKFVEFHDPNNDKKKVRLKYVKKAPLDCEKISANLFFSKSKGKYYTNKVVVGDDRYIIQWDSITPASNYLNGLNRKV